MCHNSICYLSSMPLKRPTEILLEHASIKVPSYNGSGIETVMKLKNQHVYYSRYCSPQAEKIDYALKRHTSEYYHCPPPTSVLQKCSIHSFGVAQPVSLLLKLSWSSLCRIKHPLWQKILKSLQSCTFDALAEKRIMGGHDWSFFINLNKLW